MISHGASLAFWGQALEELWLLWWQPHVASRACGDSTRAGLAEIPHVETRCEQVSRRLVTIRPRGDSSRAGLTETCHGGPGGQIGTWESIVHRVTLVQN